nr:probable methionine--tRNA ligase [Tanacetum cinerariifolium]
MLAPSGEGLILYQAYGNLYDMTGGKSYLLEDKQILSVGVFDEVSLPPPQAVCHKQHLLSLKVQQMLGENVIYSATEEPPSHTKGRMMIWKLTKRMRKWIATDEVKEPTKKLVHASNVIRPDPDESVRVPYMINGKMNEVIKVVKEEAEMIGLDPKIIVSAKAGEKFKKAQDALHQVLKYDNRLSYSAYFRKACVLCNLKPATMMGIKSHDMVLCASISDKVELVEPPASAVIGERVTFYGFNGEPDVVLNPKKKAWETLQMYLHTDKDLVACYKDVPFTTSACVCKVLSTSDGTIR